MNYDHGAFSVSIDGGAAATFSSYSPQLRPVQALFGRAVEAGRHVATVTSVEDGKGTGVSYFM